MQAAAVHLLGLAHNAFWDISLKEYNALIDGYVTVNDPDGSKRAAHTATSRWTPELEEQAFELMERLS